MFATPRFGAPLIAGGLLALIAGCASGTAGVEAHVTKVLEVQEQAWNRGDIDAFMDTYWKSEELTFSSGGKTTSGWNATLQRYRQRYPTPAEMGRLEFAIDGVYPLGKDAAFLLGRWNLSGLEEPAGGNFTLVLRRIDGKWVIVHDHTSSADQRP